MYNKDMIYTPDQNQKEEFFTVSESELGVQSQTTSTDSKTKLNDFFMLKWTPFDINDISTWPTDGKEVMITVAVGNNGVARRFVWFADFNYTRKDWSNCDCGEIVIAWCEKPKPYEG